MTLRKNRQMYGRIEAKGAWGHDPVACEVNLNIEISQLAVLGALCQAAVAEHYSFDRRAPRAKAALVQIAINYSDKKPVIALKRERSVKEVSR